MKYRLKPSTFTETDFFGLQMQMQTHQSDYSSEHEVAMYRGIASAKSMAEAIRRINSMKRGRIQDVSGKTIIENMMVQYRMRMEE